MKIYLYGQRICMWLENGCRVITHINKVERGLITGTSSRKKKQAVCLLSPQWTLLLWFSPAAAHEYWPMHSRLKHNICFSASQTIYHLLITSDKHIAPVKRWNTEKTMFGCALKSIFRQMNKNFYANLFSACLWFVTGYSHQTRVQSLLLHSNCNQERNILVLD